MANAVRTQLYEYKTEQNDGEIAILESVVNVIDYNDFYYIGNMPLIQKEKIGEVLSNKETLIIYLKKEDVVTAKTKITEHLRKQIAYLESKIARLQCEIDMRNKCLQSIK